MKIYLSGPITGITDNNIENFKYWSHILTNYGYQVITPIELMDGIDTSKFTHKDYMKICIKAMLDCDMVVGLEDWHLSKGCDIEIGLARKLGIPDVFCKNVKPLVEQLLTETNA